MIPGSAPNGQDKKGENSAKPANGTSATYEESYTSPTLEDFLDDWDGWTLEEQFDHILHFVVNPSQWCNDSNFYDVLVRLSLDKRAMLKAKSRFKVLGGDPYDLERALKDSRQRLEAAQRGVKEQRHTQRPALLSLADVTPEAVDWLWFPYLARGTLAMLDGDPGLGKSLLSVQLAANLSRGWPLPDQEGKPTLPTGAPQHTIIISAEDSPQHTILPRLLTAGGDPQFVSILEGWRDSGSSDPEEVQPFDLTHVPILEAALQACPAALVIIDPVQAYLNGVDMHRSNETRPLLAKLAAVARKFNVSIVIVRHPSKSSVQGGRAIHRGLGSIDFIGAARTGALLLPHPADPNKALLTQSKNNLAALGRTQIIDKTGGGFAWAGVSRLSADFLVASATGPQPLALIEAALWLEDQLHGSVPRLATEIEALAEEEDIQPRTLRRAKKLLDVRSLRSGTFSEPIWHWKLVDLPTSPSLTPQPGQQGNQGQQGQLG